MVTNETQATKFRPASSRAAFWLLLTVGAAIAVVLLLPPIPQDAEYHKFADDRAWLGLPNCLNVLSNLPIGAAGLMSLPVLLRPRGRLGCLFLERQERWPYVLLFLGVALTSVGSSYYHLAPSNERLVWDRLPMTLGFMSIFAAVIAERISLKLGMRLLAPLIALGAASVFYWSVTEARGMGDLRLYALVQFYPMLAIPLIIWMFPARYSGTANLVGAMATYGAAKLLETLDRQVFSAGQIVSGHTLKHIAAAAAALWILRWLRTRRAAAPAL